MRNGITKQNILRNISIYIRKAFKTKEDLNDEWKKNKNKEI